MNQKIIKYITIIGLIVLIGITVAATARFINRKLIEQATPKIIDSQQEAGWKTYVSSEWNFSIKHPVDWVIKISEREIDLAESRKRIYFSLFDKSKLESAAPDKLPLSNIFIEVWNYVGEATSFLENKEPTMIGGIAGYEGVASGIEYSYERIAEYNGRTYIIGAWYPDEELTEIERAVKFSFRFLK